MPAPPIASLQPSNGIITPLDGEAAMPNSYHEQMTPMSVWEARSERLNEYLPPPIPSPSNEQLSLSDVIASIYRAFPIIEQARLLGGVRAGEQLSAWGAYDTKVEGYTLNQPIGFYETYRHGLGVARQTWWGGYLGAGYRAGRGNFEPWYKERETNEGGEFKLAWLQPLLQGRAIDVERVELFQANLRRQAVTPEIQASVLEASLAGADAYWTWSSVGVMLRAQQRLLELAETRGEQLNAVLREKQGTVIDVILNDQLIAERRGKVVESEQKLKQAAAKLSLFLRDELGQPMVPPETWLPTDFPSNFEIALATFEEDLSNALVRRPELQLIEIEIQINGLDRELAANQLLPNLDFTVQGAQDVGAPASSLRDKSPFELEAGLVGDVPIQRRKPRGKIQSTNSKIAILDQKRRFQQDKIAVELQNAHIALLTSAESIRQARDAVNAARESLQIYTQAFQAGIVDLLLLNLVEPKVTENEIKLIEQQQRWYSALAAKQAALGLDPLEQAFALESILQAAPPQLQPMPVQPQ